MPKAYSVFASFLLSVTVAIPEQAVAQPPEGTGPGNSLVQRVETLEETVSGLEADVESIRLEVEMLLPTFVVVDASGARVGKAVGVFNFTNVFVALDVGGIVFAVEVERNGFRDSAALGFESQDCAGQAYLFTIEGVLPGVAVAPPGQTVYVEDGPAQTITVKSLLRSGECQAFPAGFDRTAAPATALVDLLSLFVPPFRAVLQ